MTHRHPPPRSRSDPQKPMWVNPASNMTLDNLIACNRVACFSFPSNHSRCQVDHPVKCSRSHRCHLSCRLAYDPAPRSFLNEHSMACSSEASERSRRSIRIYHLHAHSGTSRPLVSLIHRPTDQPIDYLISIAIAIKIYVDPSLTFHLLCSLTNRQPRYIPRSTITSPN